MILRRTSTLTPDEKKKKRSGEKTGKARRVFNHFKAIALLDQRLQKCINSTSLTNFNFFSVASRCCQEELGRIPNKIKHSPPALQYLVDASKFDEDYMTFSEGYKGTSDDFEESEKTRRRPRDASDSGE